MGILLSASLVAVLVGLNADVARVPAASRGVDLYAIQPDRVEGSSVDGGKLARSVVRAIEDGLLSATPIRKTLPEILRTSTPTPAPTETPRPLAALPSVQAARVEVEQMQTTIPDTGACSRSITGGRTGLTRPATRQQPTRSMSVLD